MYKYSPLFTTLFGDLSVLSGHCFAKGRLNGGEAGFRCLSAVPHAPPHGGGVPSPHRHSVLRDGRPLPLLRATRVTAYPSLTSTLGLGKAPVVRSM